MRSDHGNLAPVDTSLSSSYALLSTWLKRLFALLAFGVVVYLFWPLLRELRNVAVLIKQAGWEWIGFAVLTQVISYSCLAALNYLLLQPFQGRITFWQLMALLPAMAFIEVALPSGGLSGVILRARLLKRNAFSIEASSFTLLMESLYLATAMITASVYGVWYLIQGRGLNLGRLALLASVTISLLVVGLLFFRGVHDKKKGRRWANWLAIRWNRIMKALHRPVFRMEDLEARLDNFYAGLYEMERIPRGYLLGTAIGRVSLDIISLGMCFIAFHYAISPGILLTGYGLMMILSGLAALPGGLGLADVSLAVVFSRLGAPGAVAVAAALTYRLIAFWLVRFVGFVSWQVMEMRI